MYWEAITLAALLTVLYLGYRRGTSYIGEFVIGTIFGLYWEISAHRLFEYANFSIYIYKDVSLAIILMWGVTIAGFTLISDFLQERASINHKKFPNTLFWDVVTAGVLGTTLEFAGSQLFNLWTYPADTVSAFLYGVPLQWIKGWFFIGVFVMGFNRYYQNMFEIKKWKKFIEKGKRR
jgi:hypothetical protein